MATSTDDPAQALLAGLVRRYGLGAVQRNQLAGLLALIGRDRRAPTAVRAPELGVEVHLADSLVVLELEAVRRARTIADIGSGAGFPGLPIAVARPACQVRLIESQSRKCAFLARAIAEVEIENAQAVCSRAEEWAEGSCANDVVVARAVGPQPVVLEYAAPLLRTGGTLVDWRGRRAPEEERRAMLAAEALGLELVGVERVQPFEGARDHHLHMFMKVRETPAGFPRRPGMARKRPLGR
jgi:16S rRNA (guanine527-N7)-methyltransferase